MAEMDAFDYHLPAGAIAQTPAEPRTSARLLVATDPGGSVRHMRVADLPELLAPGDLLVVNETRVIPARLRLRKATGGAVEVLLLEPDPCDEPGRPERATSWRALVRPGRRVPPGTKLFSDAVGSGFPSNPVVEVNEREGSSDPATRRVEILDPGLAELEGRVAFPPYIHDESTDPARYQTVYARTPGSVAAPTAGLHFDRELLQRCEQAGAATAAVDLTVGLDTFRPVSAPSPAGHVMHSERYRVPAETLDACENAARVIAVGTTTVRALESAASTGELSGRTSLFIHTAFDFRVVDVLLTNFHLPRSSLLLMLDAFCGPRWRDLYGIALRSGYRFLSFGDAMLVARRPDVRSGSRRR